MNDHFVAADAVEIHVHCAHAAHLGRQLHAFDELFLERALLIAIELLLESIEHVLIGDAKKCRVQR